MKLKNIIPNFNSSLAFLLKNVIPNFYQKKLVLRTFFRNIGIRHFSV